MPVTAATAELIRTETDRKKEAGTVKVAMVESQIVTAHSIAMTMGVDRHILRPPIMAATIPTEIRTARAAAMRKRRVNMAATIGPTSIEAIAIVIVGAERNRPIAAVETAGTVGRTKETPAEAAEITAIVDTTVEAAIEEEVATGAIGTGRRVGVDRQAAATILEGRDTTDEMIGIETREAAAAVRTDRQRRG